MSSPPWWELAAPRIHSAGSGQQGWTWRDPLRVLHDHELFVVGRGFRGRIDIDDGVMPLDGPAWAIIPCGMPHVCHGEDTGARRGWVHFDWTHDLPPPSSLFTYGRRAPPSAIHPPPPWAPRLPRGGPLRDARLLSAHADLTRSWSRGGPHASVHARGLLLELLTNLLVDDEESQTPPLRVLAEQIRQCLDRLAALPAAQTPPLPLGLAEFGRDSDHLARIFRQAFGITPIRYMIEVRVGRACAMLADGTSLAETAADLGFSDSAYLSRLVRRISGHPPRWYKARR